MSYQNELAQKQAQLEALQVELANLQQKRNAELKQVQEQYFREVYHFLRAIKFDVKGLEPDLQKVAVKGVSSAIEVFDRELYEEFD